MIMIKWRRKLVEDERQSSAQLSSKWEEDAFKICTFLFTWNKINLVLLLLDGQKIEEKRNTNKKNVHKVETSSDTTWLSKRWNQKSHSQLICWWGGWIFRWGEKNKKSASEASANKGKMESWILAAALPNYILLTECRIQRRRIPQFPFLSFPCRRCRRREWLLLL